MYNVYNEDGKCIAEQIDAYDNVYDAKESLKAFGYEVKENDH